MATPKYGRLIHVIRGRQIMLDRDLARLYGVTTGNLNKAVSRNPERFPDDFMLTLTPAEARILRFRFGSLRWGEHAAHLNEAFAAIRRLAAEPGAGP